jgi:RPA family protein
MSASDDGPGRREVAYRLFAAEFDDATVSYAESDEERAPKYVVTPTGARVNRMFAVGVLTEVESVNDDVLRARVVDPTGAFVSYAGQYQPDAAAFFERTDPPAFVALTGKARTFQPEDGNRVYTSVRPESVSAVDAETRDRWTVSAAEATLRRVAAMADALSMDQRGDDLEAALLDRGYDASLAAGIPIALDHYGTTVAYLDAVREMALDALEVVGGDRDEVRALDVAPDDAGTTSLGPLPEAVQRAIETDAATPEPTADEAETTTTNAGTDATEDTAPEPTADESETATTNAGVDATEDAAPEPTTGATTTAESAASATDDAPADGATVSADTTPDDAETAAADTTPDDAETTTEPGDDAPSGETPSDTSTDDGLGDFDGGDDDGGDLGAFDDDDDLYELDEEERREVEAEFDVGFESGAEVDDPGEAGIDVPGPEDLDEGVAETSSDTDGAATNDAEVDETATNADAEDAEDDADTETSAGDVDLEAAAVDAMSDLDDGDGALHDEVVAAVVDEYGADPGAVADAIEDALMSGKCYEPSEDRLKAI